MSKKKYEIGLQNLELIHEDGQYFLDATYIFEDSRSVREVTVKRILLPVDPNNVSIDRSLYGRDLIDIGYGMNTFAAYFETILEEKVQEVTMEDIEKKFGCKVKIVREK